VDVNVYKDVLLFKKKFEKYSFFGKLI